MYQYEWYSSLNNAYSGIWTQFSMLLPNLIMALVIILIGYVLASILKGVVRRIVNALSVNSMLASVGVTEIVQRSGYKLDAGQVLGVMVKWFVLIIFFMAALDVLNLNQASAFLYEALYYLPRVIVATIILFIGFTLSGLVYNTVSGSARAAGFNSPETLGKFARAALIVFAVLAALNQLQVATELVQILFAGVVFATSLALGLSFGLGGRDAASRYIDSVNQR
ncbi:hypothetical protein H6789_02045 [Candidatus Nomurabacteria bacterium]|nr:hypothetical protein [Candidatus Nomurabacteria bacterium]